MTATLFATIGLGEALCALAIVGAVRAWRRFGAAIVMLAATLVFAAAEAAAILTHGSPAPFAACLTLAVLGLVAVQLAQPARVQQDSTRG